MSDSILKIGIFADDLNRKGMGTAKLLVRLVETYIEQYKSAVEVTLIHRAGTCTHSLCERANTLPVQIYNLPKFSGFLSLAYFFVTTKARFDIIHFPRPQLHPLFFLLKFFKKTKKIVVTFHGAPDNAQIPIYETVFTRWNRWFITYVAQYVIDAVIVDSETAKEQVRFYYKIPLEKISVIYAGVDAEFSPLTIAQKKDACAYLQRKYGIVSPYLLVVSRLDPHKNIHRLIEAFSLFKNETQSSYRLVIVGGRHHPKYSALVEQTIHKLSLGENVYIAPFIEDRDMPRLYGAADASLYVSLSEGFGLPLLESFGAGVPVITSSVSAMPEIAGGAAVLVDPYNISAIADAMRRICIDEKLKRMLVEKGKLRMGDFSWDKTAKKNIQLYRDVLNR